MLAAIASRSVSTELHTEPNADDTGRDVDAGAARFASADEPTQPCPESPETAQAHKRARHNDPSVSAARGADMVESGESASAVRGAGSSSSAAPPTVSTTSSSSYTEFVYAHAPERPSLASNSPPGARVSCHL